LTISYRLSITSLPFLDNKFLNIHPGKKYVVLNNV